MSLHKTHWYLGYNSLAIITEQERKHWLMKTDKKKTLIDPLTRDQYVGQIDNIGSDIVIETDKRSASYKALNKLSFKENVDHILSLEPSAFPQCCQVDGFCFARITSTNYPTSLDVDDYSDHATLNDDTPHKKHYRFRFENCSTEIIPFSGSNTTSDVFATRWIRTTSLYLELLDEDLGTYNQRIEIAFDTAVRDSVFYYPLSESLQTLPLESEGNGTYHTLGVTDDQYIGYPAFWFTSSTTDVHESPLASQYYAKSVNGSQLFCCGNEGNASILHGKVYVGVDGNCDATPDDSPTSDVYVICHPKDHEDKFDNTSADFQIPIQNKTIYMNDHIYDITIHGDHSNLYMTPNENWEYVDDSTYQIRMSVFDQNCMSRGSNPLISVFDIQFDDSLKPWIDVTTDVGRSGIRINSGNPYSDMYHSYPYDLNLWTGLPEHLQNIEEDHTPEHLAIYAMHDPPSYVEGSPETRQTAALLFDLGKESEIVYDFKYHYQHVSGEVPEDATLPYHYLNYIRERSFAYYKANRMDLLYQLYLAHHPKNDSETDAEYEIRMETEWNESGENEYKEIYPYYGWACENYFIEYREGRNYTDYQAHPEKYQFPDNVTITTETDFKAAILDLLYEAYCYWKEYLPEEYEDDMYLHVDVIFGLVMKKNQDVSEDIIRTNQIVDCYDNDGNYICKANIRISPTGKFSYFGILQEFSPTGDVRISDGVWHITQTVWAADDGADQDIKRQHNFEFDMYAIKNMDDVGRIYLLSNDDNTYANNKNTPYPKPDRTLARICDIPTSVVQLTGISGISPISVVDPKYVRTEVNYTEDDKDRLYNTLGNRWIRPTADRIIGATSTSDNDFVFTTLDDLSTVDMNNEEYYIKTNLNPKVDPLVVKEGTISDPGEGYMYGDYGLIFVGGFAFQYNVTSVSSSGGVTGFTVSAVKTEDDDDKTYPDIAISNFDFSQGFNNYTATYGTAPVSGKGKGFKCRLYIPDVEQYRSNTKGELFSDLFALVRLNDGLWIYQYTNSEWKKSTCIAKFESTSTDNHFQSTTDAFMASILPSNRSMRCYRYDDNETAMTDLKVLSTASFINVIDTNKTPIQSDTTISSTSTRTSVDLCKWRCNGISRYAANTRTMDAVFETLKDVLQADCYLAFRWLDDEHTTFYAGIITRGFNNILSDGKKSMLPENTLPYQNGINSNGNTTIVWDVPDVGPMMWTFNPNSQVHEKYHIDPLTQTFYIEREQLKWDQIDIYSSNVNEKASLFDDGILQYDIYTNSPYAYNASGHTDVSPIYAQPNFWKLVSRGTSIDKITELQNPTGNWACVFPRVHGFVFENDVTNIKHIPIQMQMIHDVNIVNDAKLLNEETNQDESMRTLIIEDTSDGVRLRAYNSETSKWDLV